MKIKKEIIKKIIAHAKRDAPIEACGYLASKAGIVAKHYEMTNINKSQEHFSFAPEEQFEVVKDARAGGLEICAVYHSHPETDARPSPEDIKLAFDPNLVYVIVSLQKGKQDVKAFTIKHGKVEGVKMEIEGKSTGEVSKVETDLSELKRVGMIQQKQKDYFAMRLRTVGGDLTTVQLKKIAEVADKYADGRVHLSTRQGVEIHNVHHKHLVAARQELKEAGVEMGACGPRIRVIVACPGEVTCRWGIIETKQLAKELDAKYFRKDTPHKFKLAVTGCPHNCAKATENDVGIMGGILPKWEEEKCIHCDLCVNICPTKAISKQDDQYKLDKKKCILCSICTASCPTSSWVVEKKGYIFFIGGTMGKKPRFATRYSKLIEDKTELMKLIEQAVQFYRKHGRKKERFGHLIDRFGEEKAVKEITDGV